MHPVCSTQRVQLSPHLRFPFPKSIKGMVFWTRSLKYWVLGPCGVCFHFAETQKRWLQASIPDRHKTPNNITYMGELLPPCGFHERPLPKVHHLFQTTKTIQKVYAFKDAERKGPLQSWKHPSTCIVRAWGVVPGLSVLVDLSMELNHLLSDSGLYDSTWSMVEEAVHFLKTTLSCTPEHFQVEPELLETPM